MKTKFFMKSSPLLLSGGLIRGNLISPAARASFPKGEAWVACLPFWGKFVLLPVFARQDGAYRLRALPAYGFPTIIGR